MSTLLFVFIDDVTVLDLITSQYDFHVDVQAKKPLSQFIWYPDYCDGEVAAFHYLNWYHLIVDNNRNTYKLLPNTLNQQSVIVLVQYVLVPH